MAFLGFGDDDITAEQPQKQAAMANAAVDMGGGFFGGGDEKKDDVGAWNMVKRNPKDALILMGLSMMANSQGGNGSTPGLFGILAKSGLNTLQGLGGMEEQRRAIAKDERDYKDKRADAEWNRDYQNRTLASKDAYQQGMLNFHDRQLAQQLALEKARMAQSAAQHAASLAQERAQANTGSWTMKDGYLVNSKTGEVRRATGADGKPIQATGMPKFDDVKDMNAAWSKASSDYLATGDALKNTMAYAKRGTAAGDMALIYAYMKSMDPTSTVREGEFASAQNAAGVPERIINMYNNARNGTRLSDDQRKDFVSVARDSFATQQTAQQNRNKHFTNWANAYNINPELVFSDGYSGLLGEADTWLGGGASPQAAPQMSTPKLPEGFTLDGGD